MPAGLISIRDGHTGIVTPAASSADVITAINRGDDILFNGQLATLTNIGGQWLIQGQPVNTWFPTVQVIPPIVPLPVNTGPNVVPPDTGPPDLPPIGPIIRTEPLPITGSGSLNLTTTEMVVLAAAAYFLFFRRRS